MFYVTNFFLVPPEDTSSDGEILQDILNRRTDVTIEPFESSESKSNAPSLVKIPIVASLSKTMSEEKVDDIVTYTELTNVIQQQRSSHSPSTITQEVVFGTSSMRDLNIEHTQNRIEVSAQINAISIHEPDTEHEKQTPVTTTFISNGAIFSKPDTVELLDSDIISKPQSVSTQSLHNISIRIVVASDYRSRRK